MRIFVRLHKPTASPPQPYEDIRRTTQAYCPPQSYEDIHRTTQAYYLDITHKTLQHHHLNHMRIFVGLYKPTVHLNHMRIFVGLHKPTVLILLTRLYNIAASIK